MTKQELLGYLTEQVCADGAKAFAAFNGTATEYFATHERGATALIWCLAKGLPADKVSPELFAECARLESRVALAFAHSSPCMTRGLFAELAQRAPWTAVVYAHSAPHMTAPLFAELARRVPWVAVRYAHSAPHMTEPLFAELARREPLAALQYAHSAPCMTPELLTELKAMIK